MIARSASVCAAGWDLHSMQICKALNSDSTGMNEASIHNSYVHKKSKIPFTESEQVNMSLHFLYD
jgi:hypothetical protein